MASADGQGAAHATHIPAEARPGDRAMVYLVTFSALVPGRPTGADVRQLRDVAELSRADIRDAVLDVVATPAIERNPRGGRPRERTPTAVKLVVAAEWHAERPDRHFHVAVKLSEKTRFLPFATALLQRHNLASHWSTTHTQWWSAVRYLCVPSVGKPCVDAEPLSWTADGSAMNLYEASQEPFNASALKARREKRALQPTPADGAKQAKVDKFTKLDFTALALAEGFRTKNDVLAYVQEKGSASMQTFVNRHQRRLAEFLDDATEWANAPAARQAEQETDWALIERLAGGSCKCGGGACAWWAAAESFFERNKGIDRHLLAASLRKVIAEGPSKTARVPMIVGPTNAGKSTMFNPLYEVFGARAIFNKPKLGASCPLANLPKHKRFILFDDFRPVEYAALPNDNPTISCTTFLAMFQQQPFDVQVSQSFNNGHPEIVWARGAAMTAKDEGLWEPFGMVSREDIRHMQSRVLQFHADAAVDVADFSSVPRCPESFARWLLVDSAAFAARPGPRPPRPLRAVRLPCLPEQAEEGDR